MKNNKAITIVLSVIIVGLTIYSAWSNYDSVRQIKQLTGDLKSNVDSLSHVKYRYDSLSAAYQMIYLELDSAQSKLVFFKEDMDSIMSLRINSVISLKKTLTSIIEEHGLRETPSSKEVNTNFRFR